MKKTLIALAALAATGAFAQSTVTIYGAIDAAYTNYSTEGVSVSGMGNSQLGSSKIGFMGTEDLGGGLKAIFKLEGGLANDSGNGKASNTNNQVSGRGLVSNTGMASTAPGAPNGNAGVLSAGGTQGLAFARYSYVGLSGNFGEVKLGRDYTSTFRTIAAVDVFGTNGPADASQMLLALAGINKQQTGSGASNMIGYQTPAMGGFGLDVQAFFGENPSVQYLNLAGTAAANPNDGDGYSVAVNYANGPVYVSLAQQVTKGTVQAATISLAGTNGDYTQRGLSASYDFGMAKVIYTNAREELIKTAGTSTNATNLIGVAVPMGATTFKASYARSAMNTGVAGAADNTGTLFGLGADYALSKRTKLYGTWSRVTNDNVAAGSPTGYGALLSQTATNPTTTGLALGIFHSF